MSEDVSNGTSSFFYYNFVRIPSIMISISLEVMILNEAIRRNYVPLRYPRNHESTSREVRVERFQKL